LRWIRGAYVAWLIVVTATWQLGLFGSVNWLWVSFAIVVGTEILTPFVIILVVFSVGGGVPVKGERDHRSPNPDGSLNPPNRARSKRRRVQRR
jgi:hypothetical protein